MIKGRTMKGCGLVISLLLLVGIVQAGDSSRAIRVDSATTIRVKKDTRVDILNRKQAILNKTGTLKPHLVREPGYRLQVISTQDRAIALGLKSDLLNRFPAQPSYLLYQAPLFRIRVGNFRTRQEALSFRNTALAYLPEVFIVRDIIEYMWYPPGEEE